MNLIRKRVEENFPSVLLTLLSIVQALALELLWEHVQNSPELMQLNWLSLLSWLQIVTTGLGIILIWVTYASNAMRFRWVPSTADSVYPFLIGLLEFLQIELLNPNLIGPWAILMGVIFASMVLVSHLTMRSARRSGDNGDFFSSTRPATLKDFSNPIAVIVCMIVGGAVVGLTHNNGVPALLLILATLAVLIWQSVSSAVFWNTSVSADTE